MASIAKSLLGHVPEARRAQALQDIVRSLTSGDASLSDLVTAISLLHEYPDAATRRELCDRLQSRVEEGHFETVLSACTHDLDLRVEMLCRCIAIVYSQAGRLQHGSSRGLTVSMKDMVLLKSVDAESSDSGLRNSPPLNHEAYLGFARLALTATEIDLGYLDQLLQAALVLLGSSNQGTCRAAREAVLVLVTLTSRDSKLDTELVWRCVQKLTESANDSAHQNNGYVLWLRCTMSGVPFRSWLGPAYWKLLRQGLQYGDAERRKQCLSILRQSIELGANDPAIVRSLCRQDNDAQDRDGCPSKLLHEVPSAVKEQYERYCTVFETILLGRYLNQVVECEGDLQTLASSQSALPVEWLYALLASALAPKIQESNRKFIGNWIMRSAFRAGGIGQFVPFFSTSFLPWATQGSLFTSTIKHQNGSLHCSHGERLCEYLAELLTTSCSSQAERSQLIDAILELVRSRRGGNFPYATIFLLEGLGRAYDSDTHMALNNTQLETLVNLTSWLALPEVARDYVYVRCLKICGESILRSSESLNSRILTDAITQWNTLGPTLEKSAAGEGITLPSDPIIPWSTEPSKRDVMELEAVEKCDRLHCSIAKGELAEDELISALEDLWGDLEYLEYPKALLLRFPSLILDSKLLQLANSSASLASAIADMVRKLQALSVNKVYLLTPLMCSLRIAITRSSETLNFLPVEDLIVNYALHLPEPTIDLQLEDVTAGLLRAVTPAFEGYGYEHYFGSRESVGIAAILDLVSRLGAHTSEVLHGLLERMLRPWAKQRSPPPTVSPWKSSLQLQILLLCCEQAVPKMSPSKTREVLHDLLYVLSIEPLPRYRYLLSWIVARIYLAHADLENDVLDHLGTKDHHSNPKYLASLMKIGVMLASVNKSGEAFAAKLASAFVPLAASSKVVIRHEAQWQVPILMDLANARGWDDITESTAFRALDEYIRSLARFDDPPLERQLDRFDPMKDHNMTNLVEGRWYGLDNTEVPMCGHSDFVKLYAGDAEPSKIPPSCILLGEALALAVKAAHEPFLELSSTEDRTTHALAPSRAGESRALQTKGTAYLVKSAEDSSEQEARRNDLIVVASLVDNPYNLGGLSRVSEIFGASEMHLQNQNVTSNKDFSNVSVSSHLHLPICQLSASAVPEYLSMKRSQGWMIVGIEQTDRSVILGSEECKIPDKVVLVIGSEKEGIPAAVLSECDMLVEIPQQGITRSLNVQTAAAIVLFEYAKQRRKSVAI